MKDAIQAPYEFGRQASDLRLAELLNSDPERLDQAATRLFQPMAQGHPDTLGLAFRLNYYATRLARRIFAETLRFREPDVWQLARQITVHWCADEGLQVCLLPFEDSRPAPGGCVDGYVSMGANLDAATSALNLLRGVGSHLAEQLTGEGRGDLAELFVTACVGTLYGLQACGRAAGPVLAVAAAERLLCQPQSRADAA